jgi:hypothetical protein
MAVSPIWRSAVTFHRIASSTSLSRTAECGSGLYRTPWRLVG